MDPRELTAVLAGPPKPDRAEVLASFRRKHHRRKVRQRLLCAGGAVAGLTVTIALVASGQSRPSASVASSPARCTQASLAQALARARQAGASILIASESPAGQASSSGYAPVVLQSVRTLSGPAVSSGTIAWTDGPAIGGATGPASSGTRATGGRVFAIAWPAAVAGSVVGPVLRAAPVIGGNVIFTASGCAHAAERPGPAGRGLGNATSGDGPPGGIGPAVSYAVPLRTVVQAAASSPGDSKEDDPQVSPGSTAPGQGSGKGNGKKGKGATAPATPAPSATTPAAATQTSASKSGNGNGKAKGTAKANSQGKGNGKSKASGKVTGDGNG